jgi:thiol:disulfide interchange protein
MALFLNRRLFQIAAIIFLITGCDVRDETVNSTQSIHHHWPKPVTNRIEQHDSRDGQFGAARISFIENCDAGLRLAKVANKPLLIVFRAAWCRWSMALTQQTLSDPSIVSLTDGFICVQVDADRHSEACRKYNVTQFPTILIVGTGKKEICRRSGHTLVTDLTPILQQALSPNQFVAHHPHAVTNNTIPEATNAEPLVTQESIHTAKTPTQQNAR